MSNRAFDQGVPDEIIRRVVEPSRPQRLILFGSAARGEMSRQSDVDPVVAKNRTADGVWRRGSTAISRGATVDVTAVTVDERGACASDADRLSAGFHPRRHPRCRRELLAGRCSSGLTECRFRFTVDLSDSPMCRIISQPVHKPIAGTRRSAPRLPAGKDNF